MRKIKLLLVASLSLFVSCTKKDVLPQNPKDNEKYVDWQGNSWIYNAAMMHWALTRSGSTTPSYYFYPRTNSWTNTSGVKVNAPANIKTSTYSTKPNSSTKSSYQNSNKPSSGKSFGSSVRPSRSFGS